MAAVLEASKSQPPAEEKSYTIDLGGCQRKSVQALIEARVAQRSAGVAREHASLFTRASLLFSKNGKSANLGDIVDRSSSLISLRRTGFTPEDFIQSGPDMTFKRLANAYNLEDLVKFGFTLRHFSAQHYRTLGLAAPLILNKVPLTGDDLIQFGLDPHFLRELRFTFSHFVHDLKMTSEQLKQLMPERDMKMYFSPSQSELDALHKKSSAGSKQSRFLQTNVPTNNLTF